MGDDGINVRVRYWANMPRRTHRVMVRGEHIGDVWDDGNITLHDDMTAHQYPRLPDGTPET